MSSNNNNSWSRGAKVTDNYKDSFSRKKEKQSKKKDYKSFQDINNKYIEETVSINKEFNLYDHDEMKPDLFIKENNEKISYLEKCKIKKKEDEKNKLSDGWIALKGKKGSTQYQITRNNIDYYDTIKDSYTENELENIRLREEYEDRINLEITLDNIYLKRLQDSIKYFNLYNENNTFLDELEIQQEKDINLDKLDEEFIIDPESESESDSEYYESD